MPPFEIRSDLLRYCCGHAFRRRGHISRFARMASTVSALRSHVDGRAGCRNDAWRRRTTAADQRGGQRCGSSSPMRGAGWVRRTGRSGGACDRCRAGALRRILITRDMHRNAAGPAQASGRDVPCIAKRQQFLPIPIRWTSALGSRCASRLTPRGAGPGASSNVRCSPSARARGDAW